MTWSKTPPSEDGWYWTRWINTVTGQREDPIVQQGVNGAWLFGADVAAAHGDGYEFWSERIEEPVDPLEHFQVEVKGYPLELIPPGILSEARMHLEERFKIHGTPRPWVSEVVQTVRDLDDRLWLVSFLVTDGRLGAARGAICDPYGAKESAP